MAARPPIAVLKDVKLADGSVMLFDGVDLTLEARARACLETCIRRCAAQ